MRLDQPKVLSSPLVANVSFEIDIINLKMVFGQI